MNNTFTFNGESPIMSGTWYNPNTGDKFTVQDTFFQDNQLIVQTTDGRTLDSNTILHYIQSDKAPNLVNNSQNDIPAEVKALVGDIDNNMLEEDNNLINGLGKSLGNLNNTLYTSVAPVDVNDTIIEKALNGKSKPNIHTDFEWKDVPEKEMHLLIDILGITTDELIDWYLKSYDITNVINIIKRDLKSYITNIICKDGTRQEPVKDIIYNKDQAQAPDDGPAKKTKTKKTKK